MKIIYCLISLLIATLASLVSFSMARAETPIATLKPLVVVASEIITLGDLFIDAGMHSETAVFRSPDLGKSGRVDANVVALAAARAGLSKLDLAGIQQVEVTRSAIMITAEDITALLQTQIASRLTIANAIDIDINYSDPIWAIPADELSPTPLRIVSLNLSTPLASQGGLSRFDVLLVIDQGNREQKQRLRGTARAMAQVAVLTRQIRRGEVIKRGDIEISRLPLSRVRRLEVALASELIGFEARRAMRAGVPLSASDVRAPTLISRNDRVVISLQSGRLRISAQGRAVEDGALGDTISVINSQSKRTIDAIVIGRGQVRLPDSHHFGKKFAGITNTYEAAQ
ncbi:MAG: flagellar basal body P-ring formation protein FlgA [Rhizobiales bacterium]|nr:flagellar basal body P-ring formation protein FlgA [Hyphomicrobiales bacterium]